jgi:benzil reductase ((S)-benzoin forming)
MTILITGISKGLGSGLANYYLNKGETVYAIGRNKNKVLEGFPDFKFLSQDLSKFDEMELTIPGFIGQAGEIDLVILNAGVLPEIKDLGDCSIEEITGVMDVNVWSNKILIDILFRKLKNIRQIAAVSSGASVYGNRGWNAYSISKAALNMLIKLYAAEHKNTHFCSIAPGLIDSGMQDYIRSLPDDPRFPSVTKLKDAKRSGRMPGPDEAGKVVAESLVKALKEESGSFLDVRDMD